MNEQILRFLRENTVFLLVLTVLVGLYFTLRTKGTKLASLEEFEALISTGKPTVVEFYSNT